MKRTISLRKLLISALVCLCAVCLFVGAGRLIAGVASADEADYAAENWTAYPQNDFTPCDKGNTSEQKSDYLVGSRELRLTGGAGAVGAANGSAYLSSLFFVNPAVDDYADFTFTLTFRATYWLNETRWFGVMYRMQTDENGLPAGYIFTNRMNTASSYTANAGKVISGVTGGDNGFQDTNHATAKNAYTDGKYHTVTITMTGDTAKHYVDGKLIGTAVTTDKDAIVGGHAAGGFALLVSQCTINVKSCTISRTVTEPTAETLPQEVPAPGDYEVTDFSAISASDWSVDAKSDTAGTKVSVNADGELVVKAISATNASYFGGLLPVNAGAVYRDFTFELEFKVTPRSWQNLDRWIGIVYHANWERGTEFAGTGGADAGYIMSYRVSGRNCYSAVNRNRAFKDDNEIAAGGLLADGATVATVLSDGAYHTMTVTMTDNAAKHYIDGYLVREAPASTKDAHLGTTYTSGGFALIVNAMELNIRSCKVTSAVGTPAAAARIDDTVVSTYQNPDVKIVNAPTVVCDVTDAAVLQSLSAEKKPSNAILRLRKDGNVVGADGAVLDSFSNVYESLNHKIIPVVSVADEEAADALIAYLNDTLNILDLAVASENPALVKRVRTACPRIRGIVIYGAAEIDADDLYGSVVGTTNANLANTAIIPRSAATAESVRYIQARFKTVWVAADSAKQSDLYACINSGAFGVVSPDTAAVYGALESYPEHSYTRMPYNIAHRGSFAATGVPAAYPTENSLGAVNEAIALGASHLELDVHLTKDGRIVVMHDTTIDRTTTGSGNIGDMTLAQIRQFKLKDGQHIPVLEEVFEILERHKDLVLVLELKAGATIVETIDGMLGTGEGQYDVRDQLVIITFNNSGDDLLTDIKNVMPTVPAAYLLTGNNAGTMIQDLASMGYYNCGMDIGYNDDVHQAVYNKACLTDRGISSWYWTFDSLFAITEQAELGHTGVTNNAAGVLMNTVNRVEGVAGQKVQSLQAGDTVKATAVTYYGETRTVDATVFYAEKTENYWNVVVRYTFTNENGNEMTLYSPAFIVGDTTYGVEPTEPEPTEPEPIKPEPSDGAPKGMGAGTVAAIALSCAAAAAALGIGGTVLFMKRKRK